MIWYNGKTTEKSAEEIFSQQEALFETLRVKNSQVEYVDLHLARLQQSCVNTGLRVQVPFSSKMIAAFLRGRVRQDLCYRFRLILSTSDAVMQLEPYQPLAQELYQQGIKLKRAQHPSLDRAQYKYWQRKQYHELHQDALNQGFHEALLCDGNELLETATSNFLMIHNSVVFIPPLGKRLPGVMLQEVLKKCSMPIREEKITWPLPADARCYITSSLKGFVPVKQIDEENFLVRCSPDCYK